VGLPLRVRPRPPSLAPRGLHRNTRNHAASTNERGPAGGLSCVYGTDLERSPRSHATGIVKNAYHNGYARWVLRLYGMPVTPDDASWLVAQLYADAYADAVETALWIEKGVDRDLYAVALSPEQRDAMLRVMIDPPDGLAELCGALMREHRGQGPLNSCVHRADGAT